MSPGSEPQKSVCFPSQGPQQLLCSLCIKSIPQQLSTDTPQPGIVSLISGPGFLFLPESSLDVHTDRSVRTRDKSAPRGVHGCPGKQGEPGEEQGDNELGSHTDPET